MGAATVPVVLLGRYTTLAGTSKFTTSPIVVSEYSGIELAVWRGDAAATTSFTFSLEESMDRETWTVVGGAVLSTSQETTLGADLTRTWLRAAVEMTSGSFPVVSCYAVGFLMKRRD